jgi:hypothetical protein
VHPILEPRIRHKFGPGLFTTICGHASFQAVGQVVADSAADAEGVVPGLRCSRRSPAFRGRIRVGGWSRGCAVP